MFALRSMAAGSFLLKGLLKKSRLLRRPAPIELRPTPNWCWTARNDTKGIFRSSRAIRRIRRQSQNFALGLFQQTLCAGMTRGMAMPNV